MTGPRMTASVCKVVTALLADPAAERYGLELMQDTRLASGTLYPILGRLERAGWVQARWEDLDPAVQGRPNRRYYRLTAAGAAEARAEVALHPAPPQRPRRSWESAVAVRTRAAR